MLIWTNFDRFAIKYLIQVACFKNFICHASLFANTKGLGTSFQAAVSGSKEFLDEIFSFVI